ncbi:Sjogren's syndrome/scleroderma autoantigen 1 family protein [Natronorubrum daqingense]|uniref:Sjogren's syndrome/scleroderma autoantigen 1 (Autoantigen p27) n=1 Tax=Natronorubrum daqingense TaxID=588898 RepID=A0A1N7F7S3_9EURY|nr:Sjogren's syndrome/scleroderma autoantigen 1 family protein [Natronorubrum daqingense]APX97595.1 hypothetical protein BB347_13800 [Natronorubrum daqingense]SIR96408.1 Sjogren's syndrome/scleroderma autoantigen 1 (Autoantigen p27) [Natronorubrum daqingense]
MSDFDKEAEREKLREKYERDAKEREATQRMSDLLLKGATMTNAHCGTCGDPLFQQNGTTFCPSCHGNPDAVEGTDLEAQPANESAGNANADATADAGNASDSTADSSKRESRPNEAAASNTAGQPDGTATERPNSSGNEGASSNAGERPTQNAAEHPPSKEPTQSSSSAAESVPNRSVTPEQPSTPDQRSPSARQPTADVGVEDESRSPRRDETSSASAVDGDREAARASLVRALEKFAAKAAETDDPRHATACLEAAREASEALETLR